MFEKILFPTDGSDGADAAFDHVLDLAVTHDATVYVLNVANTVYGTIAEKEGGTVDVLRERGEAAVEDAARRARERDVATVTAVTTGDPHQGIVDYANDRGVDVIVMPTHGRRGLERFLLGSTTERVVRRADAPVLTMRPYEEDNRIEHPYRNVLVATDGSACSDHALETCIEIAGAEAADLHLLSVVETAALGADVRSELQIDSLEERARRIVDDGAESAAAAGVDSTTTTVEFASSVPSTIRAYVDDHDVDLVVVGTHGRTGFDRYVLGSVSEKLIRTSPVPVMTVREPANE
jgi:nucleotide-binding universal stress UspA family protein